MADGVYKEGWFGHPPGLSVLAATELWDRISFHGMQALLVLYMVGQLLLPGHVENIAGFAGFRAAIEHLTGPLSVQALASQVFGLYVGLVALTPLLGGVIGDRWLGRRWTIALGALLMTAGHFCMAFDQAFLVAMLLLILGSGLLRGNLSPQLGELYPAKDRRRAVAFQIYGATVNLGAFIAPLLTGTLGVAYGWHFGFGFAGFGMLIGLIIFLAGQGTLPPRPVRVTKAAAPRLSRQERRIVVFLVTLPLITALFWVAQSQIWNTYNIWARDHVDLTIGTFVMPVPWLQSLDGLAPFLLLPPLLLYWRGQAARGREPDELGKAAIGCFIFAASTLLLASGQWVTDARGKTLLIWVVAFHLSSNLGWLFFAPTITALFSRLAPPRVNATLIGVSATAVTLGSLISGRLGGLYESLPASLFWGLHAASVGLAGVLLLLMRLRLGHIEGRVIANPQ